MRELHVVPNDTLQLRFEGLINEFGHSLQLNSQQPVLKSQSL